MRQQQKMLTTTVLTIDREEINWASVRQQGFFVEYEIPYSEHKRWDYLHNWYMKQSTCPYYLNSGARKLYVLYPDEPNVQQLIYKDQKWPWQPMDIEQRENWHALIKLLLSAFFMHRNILISNNDFYLMVTRSNRDFVKGLKIGLHEQWREDPPWEIAVSDRATTLYPVRDTSSGTPFGMNSARYAVDRREGLLVLRRLRPDQEHERKSYYLPKTRKTGFRTSVPLLDLRNLETLQRSRSSVLHWFLTDFVAYLQELGLPFQLKTPPFQKVSKSADTFKRPQVSLQESMVALVDDRLRPHVFPEAEPDDFANLLVQRVQDIVADNEWTPTLVPTAKSDLRPGDLVLRLQDNLQDDFHRPEETDEDAATGVLAAYDDPYKQFQQDYGDTINQSLNVNTNALDDTPEADTVGDEEREEDEDETNVTGADNSTAMDSATFLSYKLPTRKWLELRLLNSLNQLCLKLMVRQPAEACLRFPILERLHDNIFLYQNAMVYRDGDALVFMDVLNNRDAERVIQERTDQHIIGDILLPAQKREDQDKNEKPDYDRMNKLLEKSRFIVSSHFVWQIEDCQERVLYDIPEIKRRMAAKDEPHPKQDFYPTYSPEELDKFGQETLEAFAAFLDTTVHEAALSYNQLVQTYKNQGLYALPGMQGPQKLVQYLQLKGILLGSKKGVDVIPAYNGISYLPETRQYHVGDKYGLKQQQERGFVLRRVIQHRPKERDDTLLEEQLREHLFPLLEVNFVRYQQYTVYPFPFKLIEMWRENRGNYVIT